MKPLNPQPPKRRRGRPRKKGTMDVVLPKKTLKPKNLGNVLTEEQKGAQRILKRIEDENEQVEYASLLQNFPEMVLGISPYPWQKDVLTALNPKESRVAMKAANGSGKTSIVAASAVLWHMVRFPDSLVVTTAGVWRQVEGQLWPHLKKLVGNLGSGWRSTSNELRYKNGSKAIGFSTNDAGKFEGWHRQGATENLLMIVDEAKTVPDCIFDAIARCQPSRLLVMSSPGASAGAFYEAFTKQRKSWDTFTVTAFDCPHITQRWVDEQIEIYGEDSPLIRSMVYGEFYDDSGDGLVVSLKSLEACVQSPPKRQIGIRVAFVDFAAGGDECVFALREGNKVTELICWRDKDTNRTLGKIINLIDKFGLSPDEVYADEGGLGLPMCDSLMAAGHDIHRVNFGSKPFDSRYANRSAEIWHTAGRSIQKKEVILPDDPTLHQQIVTRRADVSRTGKLGLEPKDRMKARGLDSPDRADAVLGCISCGGGIGGVWEKYREKGSVTIDEIYERAVEDYESTALPSGMFAGY